METMEATSLIHTGHRSDSNQDTDYIAKDYVVLLEFQFFCGNSFVDKTTN